MNPLENETIPCPYCGTLIELEIDLVAGNHTYIEDCHICCRPIQLSVSLSDDGVPLIDARTDDE